MPLSLLQLDNQYPPIWLQDYSADKTISGEAVGDIDGTYVDSNSALRKTDGHDPQNYFIRQRIEGDLFHRDLLIVDLMKQILNYLGQRSGLLFNLPATYIQPYGSVVIADIGLISPDAAMYVTAVRCTSPGVCIVTDGGGDTTFSNGATIWTTGALDNLSRGSIISGSSVIKVYNDSASNATISGFIALAAKTA